jgi:hypothetical protein
MKGNSPGRARLLTRSPTQLRSIFQVFDIKNSRRNTCSIFHGAPSGIH